MATLTLLIGAPFEHFFLVLGHRGIRVCLDGPILWGSRNAV